MTRRRLFSLGMAATAKPYSIFSGSPRKLMEPESSSPQYTTTPVQQNFNKLPLWCSGYVAPVVAPVIDGTFEWPLTPNFVFFGATPNGRDILIPSSTGRHSLAVFCSVENDFGADAQDSYILEMVSANSTTAIRPYQCQNTGALTNRTPVIGGTSFDGRGLLTGIKAMYIPEGFELVFVFGSPNTNTCRVTFGAITVPSNQPLSTLFNYS